MKRTNTTSACHLCRKRRVKCDGKKPRCSRCDDRMLQCTYSIEADGRRPASKSHVQLLRSRIELLERTLRAHAIDIDKSISGTLKPTSSAVQSQSHPQSAAATGIAGTLSNDSSMNFDQDGEARYFGLSSGRLEFQPNTRSNIPPYPSDMSHPTSSPLRMNQFYQELIREKSIPLDLEDELINLYFKWEQPWVQSVDEKMFREARATNGKYFSPLLLNSILALASRHSTRREVRTDPGDSNTAGQLFLEKAEILLHYEMKNPSITTLQALCILGNMYVSNGSDAAGWLHHGMAGRLALDMGLNLDSPSVNPTGWLNREEAELRKRIYWSLYCIDKTASMYTGRICTMLDSQAAVSLPEIVDPLNEDDNYKSRRSMLGKILKAYIGICQIIEKILLARYAPKSNISGPHIESFLSNTILELKNWNYDLPKELGLEHNGIPQGEPSLYIIHMLYHTAFILLMKPTLLRAQDSESRRISYDAASEICSVAQKYRKTFDSFRRSPVTATYCTLSAVLTLMNASHHDWEGVSSAVNKRNIELGLTVLGELSVSWNPAKRIRQNLQKLYETSRISCNSDLPKSDDRASVNPLLPGFVSKENNNRTDEGSEHLTVPSVTDTTPQNNSSIYSPFNIYDGHDDQELPINDNWHFNQISLDPSEVLPDSELFHALHNFSYMETNPIFQFDTFPDDYSSFDMLNRIQVHNM